MAHKQSSDELSRLAAKILREKTPTALFVSDRIYNDLLHDAKRLAGSVLAQDETKGQRRWRAFRKLLGADK